MSIGIRPYSINDIDSLYKVITESAQHLQPWLPWFHADYEITDTEQWVNSCINAWNDKSGFRYLIFNTQTHDILGAVGLERIVWTHKIGELGYWVASKAINQGVATTAAMLAIVDGFKVHGLHRIEINILTNNIASNHVANNIGAVFEGAFRNKLFHNGKSNMANCYSLIPSDLEFNQTYQSSE